MSVMLDLSCGGCEATARVGPLQRRAESVYGGALCRIVTDDPEDLAPRGLGHVRPVHLLLLLPVVLDGDYGGTGGQPR